jgi:DNA-binding transcriptional regulator YhcF (GntR family)
MELGVSRDAKARGLKALEQAGLVYVSRSKGKAARIELRKSN